MFYTRDDYKEVYGEREKEPSFLQVLLIGSAIAVGVFLAVVVVFSIESWAEEAPKAESQIKLSFPLPYTATVTQSGPGIKEVRTRYYVPKGKQ